MMDGIKCTLSGNEDGRYIGHGGAFGVEGSYNKIQHRCVEPTKKTNQGMKKKRKEKEKKSQETKRRSEFVFHQDQESDYAMPKI